MSLAQKIITAIQNAIGTQSAALHEPSFSGNESKYVQECIDSTFVSSVGKYVDRFEKEIADYTGSKYVVACSNATSALKISMKLINTKKKHEILIPSLSFIAPVNAVRYNKAEPIFIDNNCHYTIDANKILSFLKQNCSTKIINKKKYKVNCKSGKIIKAVVVVHTFGNAANIEKLYNCCKQNNINIIEDAAESLGTFYSKGKFANKHTGTIGTLGCLSFNGNKIITSGGGGAILTNSFKLANEARYLINQAKDDSIFYVHNKIGFNYGLTNLHASLGLSQFFKINKILSKKKKIHFLYKKLFENIKGLNISSTPEFCRSNYWLNILEIEKKLTFSDFSKIIEKINSKKIQVRPIWKPNHLQRPYLKNESYKISNFNKIYTQRLCLPSSPKLSIATLKFIVSTISNLLSK